VKLAFVVQRFGTDIAGGSEAHCRDLARRLCLRHDITVLTTCARDYVTWANAYPAGEERDEGVRVIRFPVRRLRRLKRFADLSDDVFDGGATRTRQEEWFCENGPDAPGLLDHLRHRGTEYDLVLFWTFRYAPSYFGVALVADRAILLPTAEEDQAITLDVLEDFFQKPAGYLFLTPEEQALVSGRAGRRLEPSAVIGAGLEPAQTAAGADVLRQHGIGADFVLYLGRVDRNKGCHTLLEYYESLAASRPEVPPLVLAGPAKMTIPNHPRITALGYVGTDMRDALLAQALALVVPSPFESLSIALLESWNHGVPALVNARCKVLDGQVRRANGGLSYRSSAEFSAGLDYLLTHPAERQAFGRQGLAYVDREYRWPTVLARVESVFEAVGRVPRRTGSVEAVAAPTDAPAR
jgi:glycosyltransferase involved in cell wall biosynthesis